MKKAFLLLLCILLSGCATTDDAMARGLQLRSRISSASSCSFDAEITADYGDQTYTFSVGCTFDSSGNLKFVVQSPETISGIEGTIDSAGGNLLFDDTALAFPLLADDQLSPVSAPWILMKTLRSGFITSAGMVDGYTRLIVDDSFDSDPFTLHIFLDNTNSPTEVDIYWHNRRILTLSIRDFRIL